MPQSVATSTVVLLLSSVLLHSVSAKVLPDGHVCHWDKFGNPLPPFCNSNPFDCVVDRVSRPAPSGGYTGNFHGHCNSTVRSGSFCEYRSIPFQIGTKNILDQSTCDKCKCTYHPEIAGPNKAMCDCQRAPSCFQDYNGNVVGFNGSVATSCPFQEFTCLLYALGKGGKTMDGKRIDRGFCTFPNVPGVCTAAGPIRRVKFYANGTLGVPQNANRCLQCVCLNSSQVNCRKIKGCTTP